MPEREVRNSTGVADAGGAHRLDEAEPVELRQHAVDDDDVVALRSGRHHQPVAAVVGDVRLVAAFGDPAGEERRAVLVVFDDQDLHSAGAV